MAMFEEAVPGDNGIRQKIDAINERYNVRYKNKTRSQIVELEAQRKIEIERLTGQKVSGGMME